MTFHNSALGRLVPDGNYRADDLAGHLTMSRGCLKWSGPATQWWPRSARRASPEDRRWSAVVCSIRSCPRTSGVAISKAACGEAYYLRAGEYVANPRLPLQWTRASLTVAMNALRATLAPTAADACVRADGVCVAPLLLSSSPSGVL